METMGKAFLASPVVHPGGQGEIVELPRWRGESVDPPVPAQCETVASAKATAGCLARRPILADQPNVASR
jgi:hypothetical protein